MDTSLVESLEIMRQHRAIMLIQDVTEEVDDAVRALTDEVLVLCDVVMLAEREPVRNRGLHRSYRRATSLTTTEAFEAYHLYRQLRADSPFGHPDTGDAGLLSRPTHSRARHLCS